MEGVHNGDGKVPENKKMWWVCDFPKVYDKVHYLLGTELQVVTVSPGHQPIHLHPVSKSVYRMEVDSLCLRLS